MRERGKSTRARGRRRVTVPARKTRKQMRRNNKKNRKTDRNNRLEWRQKGEHADEDSSEFQSSETKQEYDDEEKETDQGQEQEESMEASPPNPESELLHDEEDKHSPEDSSGLQGETDQGPSEAAEEEGDEDEEDVIVFKPASTRSPASRSRSSPALGGDPRKITSPGLTPVTPPAVTETPKSPQIRLHKRPKIGRAVQQECRDRSRMPSSA
eukprot:TRINITY_DN13217_c0_g1_i16.p1 TRINITY_DN13217_c0_g1~~TRINITY_DN13217_c0_g1_i16.p1  ORF type:complete len:212 (-),score=42.15 TRINITY_DN13217_c0_g1_i16:27-662(-)